MQLINKSDNYVAFKVKTTNPKKYCVRPNTGVVTPHSSCDVIVTMQAQKEAPLDMQCRDKFLLQSVVVKSGVAAKDITPEMFNKEMGNQVDECKLRVAYVPSPQPPLPVREGSEEGSSPRASVSDNGAVNQTPNFNTMAKGFAAPNENTSESTTYYLFSDNQVRKWSLNQSQMSSLSKSLGVEVPFMKATLFTPRKCFERAAEKCNVDNLSSIVGSCAWGKHVSVGTGSPFEILWDTKKAELCPAKEIDVYNFLYMVNGSSLQEDMGTGCLGEEIDDLDHENEYMDFDLSLVREDGSQKLTFEDGIEFGLSGNDNDGFKVKFYS